MKRMVTRLTLLSLVLALIVPLSAAFARTSASISLRIGDRYRGPRVYFESEPDVVLVPGYRDVYYVRDSDYDIYEVGDWWYYNYNGDWYRAHDYNGPYSFVSYRSVPRPIYNVPRRYRRHWRDYRDRHYHYSGWRDRDRNRDNGWNRDQNGDQNNDQNGDQYRDRNRDRNRDMNRGGY
jgi:hypothetical protein